MIFLVIFLLFAFAALAAIFYLAFGRPGTLAARPLQQTFTVESFFDLNARHFAQIQQALSRRDYDYLRRRGPARLARRLRRERCEVLTSYVRGLREDFENLLSLYKLLGRLESAVVREHLAETLLLELQFRALYALVTAKLAVARLASLPMDLEPLVAVVNRMAEATEAALNQLAETQTQRVRAVFS